MANFGQPRHIAIFLPSLEGGGAERVMVTLANGFAARGHRVDLVLTKAEGPYRSEVSAHVNVIDLNRSRMLTSLLPLIRYLSRERPHVMLSALNHANIVAILARKLAGVRTRLVVSERSSPSGAVGNRATTTMHWLMRLLYPYADGVIAVSQGVAMELVVDFCLDSRLVTAIPNPVAVPEIQRMAEQRPRHPWLQPGEPPILLAVGRLVPEKDYATLLDAFARLKTSRDGRLLILGEGPLRPELEQRIEELGLNDSVELAGFQSNPFGWMAACDLYVLSSRTEGFPNSLIQAMACGARIVSTDCRNGPREILEGGRWGRLVPVGDVEALETALAEALDEVASPDVLKRVADFRPEKIIEIYEASLDLCAARQ
ncbi:glycosyltransferase [Sphingosinicella microcystinivorans]|uniref:glycosyltransferase n=1 Tax=Sphingosinicella microcystinivorans TaxID=335406 RepID=UPI0022F4038B|nr:glycosyltransferase [Sphingosinicella microcystinivorans]WBX84779.1 glycosyltransferase [Sphingosinicella microcystinivorans]